MTAASRALLDRPSPEQWRAWLDETFLTVSARPACAAILRDIGHLRLQLSLTDRPELSYWEQYDGHRIVPCLGFCEDCDVLISTSFEVLIGTLLDRISVMEAAADEAYELRGDTTALMRLANILPYVASAFSSVYVRQANGIEEEAA
jgi:hypothetical protein